MADEKHYDRDGNRTGSSRDAGSRTNHYDRNDHRTGWSTQDGSRTNHYDSSGNRTGWSTQDGGRTKHYDSSGRYTGYTDSSGRSYDRGGNRTGSSSSSSSGGCYLTTTCVEARGLPDDCHELTTLRRFRDEYVRGRPQGEALVAEYYDRAPALVATISARPDGKQIFEGIYAEITQAVQHIEHNELEAAFELYVATAQRLNDTYGKQ